MLELERVMVDLKVLQQMQLNLNQWAIIYKTLQNSEQNYDWLVSKEAEEADLKDLEAKGWTENGKIKEQVKMLLFEIKNERFERFFKKYPASKRLETGINVFLRSRKQVAFEKWNKLTNHGEYADFLEQELDLYLRDTNTPGKHKFITTLTSWLDRYEKDYLINKYGKKEKDNNQMEEQIKLL
ncbi:MAG: hypothetical protein LBR13_06705 [Dysgonamonadaceae bacterium]|jgi:hypothetical protein|nr:hypothetical protein [Dysgonamonadaceae bacterium]